MGFLLISEEFGFEFFLSLNVKRKATKVIKSWQVCMFDLVR